MKETIVWISIILGTIAAVIEIENYLCSQHDHCICGEECKKYIDITCLLPSDEC